MVDSAKRVQRVRNTEDFQKGLLNRSCKLYKTFVANVDFLELDLWGNFLKLALISLT